MLLIPQMRLSFQRIVKDAGRKSVVAAAFAQGGTDAEKRMSTGSGDADTSDATYRRRPHSLDDDEAVRRSIHSLTSSNDEAKRQSTASSASREHQISADTERIAESHAAAVAAVDSIDELPKSPPPTWFTQSQERRAADNVNSGGEHDEGKQGGDGQVVDAVDDGAPLDTNGSDIAVVLPVASNTAHLVVASPANAGESRRVSFAPDVIEHESTPREEPVLAKSWL